MRARWIAAVTAALFAGGCSAILGIDKDYHLAGSGGAGGSAGASAHGGAGGAGASGGGAGANGGGTTGSSASSGGSGGGPLGCPSDTNAPVMVNVGDYCIDSTEVTESNFWKWFDMHGADALANLPAGCGWKQTIAASFGVEKYTQLPMIHVDWCDAAMFCEGVGRHLCGARGGGALASDDATVFDATKSAWFDACSDGGTHVYPYGDTYDPMACNGYDESMTQATLTVGSLPNCHGTMAPYSDVYDLSGNVYEWIDACDTSGGSDRSADMCRRLGGSSFSNSTGLECHGMQMTAQPRSFENGTSGFRCCYP